MEARLSGSYPRENIMGGKKGKEPADGAWERVDAQVSFPVHVWNSSRIITQLFYRMFDEEMQACYCYWSLGKCSEQGY